MADAVTGATNSPNAILTAVEAALTEAGSNVKVLKKPIKKAENESVTEERKVEALVIGAESSGMAASTTLIE